MSADKQKALGEAQKLLQGLSARADALAASGGGGGGGGTPANILADIATLKKTMLAEDKAADAMASESTALRKQLASLTAENTTLRTERETLRAAAAAKNGWSVDPKMVMPAPARAAIGGPGGVVAASEPAAVGDVAAGGAPKKSKNQLKAEAKAAAKKAATAAKKAGGGGGGGGGGGKKGKKGGGKGGAPAVEADGPSTPPGDYAGPGGITTNSLDEMVQAGIKELIEQEFGVADGDPSLQRNAMDKRVNGDYSRRRDCRSAAPPSPLVGVSVVMERGCQQNDSLADG